MSDLVPADQIEQIVGIERHLTLHYAKAVSAEQVVYILHPETCLVELSDLRMCSFSLALDAGIDESVWASVEDQPVMVTTTRSGRLIPCGPEMRFSS